MPNLTLSGVVLGLKSTPYDFEDAATKERRVGTSHRLYLWDDVASEPTQVSVPENLLSIAEGLGQGELVRLSVGIYATNSRVTFNLSRVLDAA